MLPAAHGVRARTPLRRLSEGEAAAGAEFWARYARWLEPREPGGADDAVRRAADVHCKRRPEAALLAARSAERRGRAAAARAYYEHVLKSPGGLAVGSLAATVACANFERRQARSQAACTARAHRCCACPFSVAGELFGHRGWSARTGWLPPACALRSSWLPGTGGAGEPRRARVR